MFAGSGVDDCDEAAELDVDAAAEDEPGAVADLELDGFDAPVLFDDAIFDSRCCSDTPTKWIDCRFLGIAATNKLVVRMVESLGCCCAHHQFFLSNFRLQRRSKSFTNKKKVAVEAVFQEAIATSV